MNKLEAKKQWDTTSRIRVAKAISYVLEENLPAILAPRLFDRIKMSQKIMFLEAIAKAKNNLWEEVYKEYPEIKGLTVSCGEYIITVL